MALTCTLYIPESLGGGEYTTSADSTTKIGELKLTFLGLARAAKPEELKGINGQYCLKIKSIDSLCHDENMELSATELVERSDIIQFTLTTTEKERSTHKLLNDRVYFHFGVRKRHAHGPDSADRAIHFDFQERTYTTLNKETERSVMPLDAMISCAKADSDPLQVRFEFKKSAPADLWTQTPQDRTMIVDIMKRVIADDLVGINNAFPRTVLYRGHVDKREPNSSHWSRRFIILVPYKLFCFSAPTGVAHPRNVIALQNARITMTNFEFDIELANGYNFHFRTTAEDESDRKMWSWALTQASQFTGSSLLSKKEAPASDSLHAASADAAGDTMPRTRQRASTVDIQRSVLNMKVFFNYAVMEQEGKGKAEARVLHVNVHDRVFTSVAKEAVKRTIPYADVADYALDVKNNLGIVISMKNGTTLKYTAQTLEECQILFALVERVMENNVAGLDANRPRLILKSGFAEKREKVTVWKKRYMMLLPWKLFCFRDISGVSYPRNCISLYNATVTKSDSEKITITSPDGYKFVFRSPSQAQRDEWYTAIKESIRFDSEDPAPMSPPPSSQKAPQMEQISETTGKDNVDSTETAAVPPPPVEDEENPAPVVDIDSLAPPSDGDGDGAQAVPPVPNGEDSASDEESDDGVPAPPPPAPVVAIDDDAQVALDGENPLSPTAHYNDDDDDDDDDDDAAPPPPPPPVSGADNADAAADSESCDGGEGAGAGAGEELGASMIEEHALAVSDMSLLEDDEEAAPPPPRARGRRGSVCTDVGLTAAADGPAAMDLGESSAAERVAKERADRLTILGYWGISNKANMWKEREEEAQKQGVKAVPVVKSMR